MEVAHLFWHGQPLSIYENASLASFVRHGFEVNLWSYDVLEAPEGVKLRDASAILPRSETEKFVQGGRPASLHGFSNSFRYRLLRDHGGWWFDADLICLGNSEDFAAVRRERPVVCGFENENRLINNAVLYVSDRQIADEFVADLERSGYDVPWGFLGAQLVTRTLNKFDLLHQVMPRRMFYPIHWSNFDIALQPGLRNKAADLCEGALTYHIWNEYLHRAAIPKNILPPEGSYLHSQFLENYPRAAHVPALPAQTLSALVSGYVLRQQTEQFVQTVQNRIPRQKRA